ncbi:MAG: GDSL-type esterase/lipase family protein [Fimbriimonas sp.]|nr:GDSL-type esterase/lipase family protein [Fimbriimonas sp.]
MNWYLVLLFGSALSALLVIGANAATDQGKTDPNAEWFSADNPHLQFYGRIGFEDPKAASFAYSATGFRTRFSGRSLALRFEEDTYGPANSFGVRIDDGPEIPIQLLSGQDRAYVAAIGLPSRTHNLEVYRRQDTYGGVAKFKGMWLDKGAKLEDPPARSRRRIEFFGDSVTSGAATLAFGYEGQPDPTIDYANPNDFINDGYWGLGATTARLLHADANVQGIGGLSLLDHTGWFGGELANTIGLETTWDKLNPIGGQQTPWDFLRFIPHVVVIAVGQNDARGGEVADPTKRTIWKETYKRLLDGLRSHYPKAQFVLITTILMHDMEWDRAIQEVAEEFRRTRMTDCVHYFPFKRVGKGTPGHPRFDEQEEMARELAGHIERLPNVWGR